MVRSEGAYYEWEHLYAMVLPQADSWTRLLWACGHSDSALVKKMMLCPSRRHCNMAFVHLQDTVRLCRLRHILPAITATLAWTIIIISTTNGLPGCLRQMEPRHLIIMMFLSSHHIELLLWHHVPGAGLQQSTGCLHVV